VDYNSVINYLFNQLANYQKVGAEAYKPGLDSITELLNELNNPHKGLKTIHLAGTNGKGSTSHILASILIENGYKVGLFTSPHIKDFRERIKVNGNLIDEQSVVSFVSNNKLVFDKLNPSFFEICTAMAFTIFSNQSCDIAIIETGLGGRLDSTNVITPEVSVITNIGIDHTNFLGTTLIEIAGEKAGIIKANVPVVIGEYQEETYDMFVEKANQGQSTLYLTEQRENINTDLLGQFQQKNCSLALDTIKILKQGGWFIDDAKTKIALTRVKKNTDFIGRLDKISSSPDVIIDASHNVDGIKNLLKEIRLLDFDNLHCVYGTSSDKDVEEVMRLFPKNASYYFTEFDSSRTMKIVELKNNALNNNLNFSTHLSPNKALSVAKQSSSTNDLIIVFGSFFLLEKII
jgi:dihydrofolate synthase/folylpolyglutamate synthase